MLSWLTLTAEGCLSLLNFRHAFHEDENFQFDYWQPPLETPEEAEEEAIMLIGGLDKMNVFLQMFEGFL